MAQVAGRGERGHLAGTQHLGRQHDARRMPKVPRSKEDKPGNGQPNENGKIDRLTKPCTGALVLNRIEQADEFVLFELPKTAGADAHRLRFNGVLQGKVRNEGDRRVRIEWHGCLVRRTYGIVHRAVGVLIRASSGVSRGRRAQRGFVSGGRRWQRHRALDVAAVDVTKETS